MRSSKHGICLPLFSLWTKRGPGTYLDLIPVIDWCADVGLHVLQLLPLNDTGSDPSPYNLISSVDLHPRYCAEGSSAYAQMERVKAHADKKKIELLGDLPLLVGPASQEVREHPEWFEVGMEVGAPPDAFNCEGQHWGFPMPRWERMEPFWQRRLEAAAKIYCGVRLDHVVGFFRLWTVDHFVPGPGKAFLRKLQGMTRLTLIAEDLGIIPEETHRALVELGIPGIRVLRWAKVFERESLTTVSTHDMPPLGAWWRTCPTEAIRVCQKKGWHYHPQIAREQRFELLRDAHRTASLYHVNLIGEYLSLFFPEAPQINVPGTVSPTNWSYRLPLCWEELATHRPLAEAIRSLIE